MDKKWYFRTLLAAFIVVVVVQQKTVVPNQEIVLEFANTNITSEEAKNTITSVTKQLQSIGVTNARLSSGLKKGQLKITYYSDEDVSQIEKLLVSKERNAALNHISFSKPEAPNAPKEFPSQENSTDYSLQVYELQKSENLADDLVGKFGVEEKYEPNRHYNYSPYNFCSNTNTEHLDTLTKVAQRIRTTVAIAINCTSHNIPEVRAGPIS